MASWHNSHENHDKLSNNHQVDEMRLKCTGNLRDPSSNPGLRREPTICRWVGGRHPSYPYS
eukprot:838595-Pelagomonas_calceolata.AAC.1